MPSTQRPFLVTGATGRQGRAAVTALLERGARVRALVRDPGGATARELALAGAELVSGDFDDMGSMRRALDGARGVFLYQPLYMSPEMTPGLGPDSELARGRAAIATAVDAGVEHVVYSSALGVDGPAVSPLLAPKAATEAELVASGLATTILRPVSFMENYAGPWRGLRRDGTISTPAPPDVREPLVAIRDIGVFAALALTDPEGYAGAALELAGDELTVPEIAVALSDRLGRAVRYSRIPFEEIRRVDPDRAASLERLYGRQPAPIDVAGLRRRHPGLLSFSGWLESGGGALVGAYLESPVTN